MGVRVLLVADSHLGFDHPLTPRVRRRRRGPDFLANYRRALEPALSGEVDVVVHGGDVFHRSRPHHTLVAQAFEPLHRVADRGIPVFVVPGNHERARIPHARFARHPGIHVFDEPRTFRVSVGPVRVAVLGFPFVRGSVRHRFLDLVSATGWQPRADELALLCMHQCFEGARVAGHTFRHAPDVVRCRDVPPGIAAVLTGHVHRPQVLTHDLSGRHLPAPVIYPGSVERTAFAEKDEPKGYVVLDVEPASEGRAARLAWRFRPLPARPMLQVEIDADGLAADALRERVAGAIDAAPNDAVLRLRVLGHVAADARQALTAASLRARAPATMNVEAVMVEERKRAAGYALKARPSAAGVVSTGAGTSHTRRRARAGPRRGRRVDPPRSASDRDRA